MVPFPRIEVNVVALESADHADAFDARCDGPDRYSSRFDSLHVVFAGKESKMAAMRKKVRKIAQGTLRIIAGKWRGRKLSFPSLDGVRPTPDRTRETLFNWLMYQIKDAKCLDCYAGSGALGFEALSRGASSITLVERQGAVAAALLSNAASLSREQTIVVSTDFFDWAATARSQGFDIIFIDPPFNQGLLKKTVDCLQQHGLITPDTILYCECEYDLALDFLEADFEVMRQKRYGQVRSMLVRSLAADGL